MRRGKVEHSRERIREGSSAPEMTAQEAITGLKQEVKDQAEIVGEVATTQSQQLATRAKATGLRVLEGAKEVAAKRLAETAQELRDFERRNAEARGIAGESWLEPVAHTVERVAAYLDARPSDELWHDFERASERRPLLAYVGVFALGFAAALVAKRVLFEEVERGN